MTRTKLCDRVLPNYTKGEEIFNTLSHSAGSVFGIVALLTCMIASIAKQDIWGLVSSIIYGSSLILLYTMSSVYHGLPKGMAKKILQVIDHCTIYLLIARTYTPVMLCAFCFSCFCLSWKHSAVYRNSIFYFIKFASYNRNSHIDSKPMWLLLFMVFIKVLIKLLFCSLSASKYTSYSFILILLLTLYPYHPVMHR